MRISIAEAQNQLEELVRRAEQGEEVILTQPGLPSARLSIVHAAAETSLQSYDAVAELAKVGPLTPRREPLSAEEKRKVFERIRRRASERNSFDDTDAAHSQDFLYDEFGLPK
ncbi:type II toxin-antitoxin system prevent-host-death family antitoxin [Neorhizobium sp. JUb45]|uniref:type II toxin-antitoxin system Phd/YefM family antitoxin n=1 Tax=unclassified Neorhizobium TaxID=2629175 RepID=UPI00104D0ADE|nr:type II toxin-antitoxin system prevent-host-death family antitoxin [Neorhizobium sp. JUb45]TCR06358.1 prevent-host-death family protein [Neorhizobium sp. JUb45]